MFSLSQQFNPFNPKYLEWYSPYLDLEHTIQICRGERINHNKIVILNPVLILYISSTLVKFFQKTKGSSHKFAISRRNYFST